jgi:arsenate reductase
MITVYGIANCDTVKKARAWLADQGLACEFHDFKKLGVPLLNRKGTTWRKLDAGQQAATVDAGSAQALMLAHPSVIKRPVVEWGPQITVGFDAESWVQRR